MNKVHVLSFCIILFLLILTGCQGITGDPGGKVPAYSPSKDISLSDLDESTFIQDYFGQNYTLFDFDTKISWTEDMGDEVRERFDEKLPDADWRIESDWSGFNQFYVSQWRKGDLEVLVGYIDNLTSDQITDINRRYGISEPKAGSTLIITHVWDITKPLPTATSTVTPIPTSAAPATATAEAIATQAGATLTAYTNNQEEARKIIVQYLESWKNKDYDMMYFLLSDSAKYQISSWEILQQLYENSQVSLNFYSVAPGQVSNDMTSIEFPIDMDIASTSASFPSLSTNSVISATKVGSDWKINYWGLWKSIVLDSTQSMTDAPLSGGNEGTYSLTINRILVWTNFTVFETTETWRPTDPNSSTRWEQGVQSAQLQDDFGNNFVFVPEKSSAVGRGYNDDLNHNGEPKNGWIYFEGSPTPNATILRLFVFPHDSDRQFTFEQIPLR